MTMTPYVRSQRPSLTLFRKVQRMSWHTGVFWTGIKLIEIFGLQPDSSPLLNTAYSRISEKVAYQEVSLPDIIMVVNDI